MPPLSHGVRRDKALFLDDAESVHHLLKERAQRVTIRVGVDGIADEVEDLRDTKPSDLNYVCLITKEPHVKVRLGAVPYVSAGDNQDARELARDVYSLISVRQRPGWQNLAAISAVRILGFGPAMTFLAVLLADVLGLISPSDHTRSLIGSVLLPGVLLGLLGSAITYKQWLKVDYATPVLPERRREARSRSTQGKSGLSRRACSRSSVTTWPRRTSCSPGWSSCAATVSPP
ncbi:hypothetical protein [Streptomyces sp. P17]|uniref:hypothetical protein n=1 Tax=Streptomyces sp. P17 TaxID=3074716 RepID=UPI0028F4125A|nr:hypothetical protein [Streptomyces sp. P17]MDT9697089.1 hypothetical protein [Streptomyces sp. P17]